MQDGINSWRTLLADTLPGHIHWQRAAWRPLPDTLSWLNTTLLPCREIDKHAKNTPGYAEVFVSKLKELLSALQAKVASSIAAHPCRWAAGSLASTLLVAILSGKSAARTAFRGTVEGVAWDSRVRVFDPSIRYLWSADKLIELFATHWDRPKEEIKMSKEAMEKGWLGGWHQWWPLGPGCRALACGGHGRWGWCGPSGCRCVYMPDCCGFLSGASLSGLTTST